jgi:hypothetical protein
MKYRLWLFVGLVGAVGGGAGLWAAGPADYCGVGSY